MRKKRENNKNEKKNQPEIESHTSATLHLTVVFAEALNGSPADHSAQNELKNDLLRYATWKPHLVKSEKKHTWDFLRNISKAPHVKLGEKKKKQRKKFH